MEQQYAGMEDLLCDDSFLSWYFKLDLHATKQWDQWIDANPGSRDQVEQAVAFLHSLRIREERISEAQITPAETRLLQKIHQLEKKAKAPSASLYPSRWWMAAASVLLLAAGLTGAYLWVSKNPQVRTVYGEVREQGLPDGTTVIVNADSKIIYSTDWKDGKDREVWLKGEAFFHVQKTALRSRFIVHTDHFDVMVTGTQFNVVNRRDKNNIMLEEGSVILHTGDGKELNMKPGEFVEYNSDKLEKRIVRNDSLLAWKEHKLLFDNTPLREVVEIIKEHYGVTVHLADDATGDKTISGILPNNNLDVLLHALEAMDIEVVRQEDSITIRNHS
jgi:transmembrane sensor